MLPARRHYRQARRWRCFLLCPVPISFCPPLTDARSAYAVSRNPPPSRNRCCSNSVSPCLRASNLIANVVQTRRLPELIPKHLYQLAINEQQEWSRLEPALGGVRWVHASLFRREPSSGSLLCSSKPPRKPSTGVSRRSGCEARS